MHHNGKTHFMAKCSLFGKTHSAMQHYLTQWQNLFCMAKLSLHDRMWQNLLCTAKLTAWHDRAKFALYGKTLTAWKDMAKPALYGKTLTAWPRYGKTCSVWQNSHCMTRFLPCLMDKLEGKTCASLQNSHCMAKTITGLHPPPQSTRNSKGREASHPAKSSKP